jgi:NTE family protein
MNAMTLPRPVGFVLGSGGSLGAIQIGILQALAEHGIIADLAAGTAVGSINGAGVARDPNSNANRLSHSGRTNRKQVLPGGLLAQAHTLRHSRTHLSPTPGLPPRSSIPRPGHRLRRPHGPVRGGDHSRRSAG